MRGRFSWPEGDPLTIKESQDSRGKAPTLNLMLFGPAGAGKGTQASFLSGRFGLVHLSTGDLLRAERKTGSILGKTADELMNRGEMVPDELVRDLVRAEVARALRSHRGILFDGYPRNIHQLADLEAILKDLDSELGFGISFEVDEARLLDRLTSRRTCTQCRRVYNVRTKPPRSEGVCDDCGGKLMQRKDDQPEVIRKRLHDYQRLTGPLLGELDRRGVLKRLNADHAIEEVRGELLRMIENGLDEVAVH